MSHIQNSGTDEKQSGKHTAGAFDIRNFIGGLLGLYGIILTLMGLIGDQELSKTGGWNANLYAGLALLVVSAVFITWARLKPTIVPAPVDSAESADSDTDGAAPPADS